MTLMPVCYKTSKRKALANLKHVKQQKIKCTPSFNSLFQLSLDLTLPSLLKCKLVSERVTFTQNKYNLYVCIFFKTFTEKTSREYVKLGKDNLVLDVWQMPLMKIFLIWFILPCADTRQIFQKETEFIWNAGLKCSPPGVRRFSLGQAAVIWVIWH